jgi:hypothetical protein
VEVKKESLSPLLEKHFRRWISVEWWHKGHPSDEERFYRFVWSVVSFSKKPPTEEFIRKLIIAEWAETLENEYLLSKAIHYSQLYTALFEFAKIRNN